MGWFGFALIAAILSGMGAVGEKQMAGKYIPTTSAMLGWLGVMLVVFGSVFAYLFPFESGTPVRYIAAIFGSGFVYSFSLFILYRALQTGEASRIYPIYNTAPIFVAIMAVFVLGEVLRGWQWVAILVTVSGAVLVSAERTAGGKGVRLGGTLLALTAAAILAAIGQTLAGYGLEEVSPYTAFWAQRFGAFAILIFVFRKQTFKEMAVVFKNPIALGVILLTEAIVMPVAHVFFLEAFKRGQVALVATIFATAPLWVFIFSSILSLPKIRIMDERLNHSALVQKGLAIVLVVIGITGINIL